MDCYRCPVHAPQQKQVEQQGQTPVVGAVSRASNWGLSLLFRLFFRGRLALTALALAAGWWWIHSDTQLGQALFGRAFLVLAILAASSWWRWMR
jgi:hypothetical protein